MEENFHLHSVIHPRFKNVGLSSPHSTRATYDDVPPTVLAVVQSVPELMNDATSCYIPASKSVALQCTPQLAEHTVNTIQKKTTENSMMHLEGGWSKEINAAEHQETSKWRKRKERDPGFVDALKQLTAEAGIIINTNISVDMHEIYFEGEDQLSTKSDDDAESPLTIFNVCCEYEAWRDNTEDNLDDSAVKDECLEFATPSNRQIKSIHWSPVNSCFLSAYERGNNTSSLVSPECIACLWDFMRPSRPSMKLRSQTYCSSFDFKCDAPNELVSGGYTGGILLWDLRVKDEPIQEALKQFNGFSPVKGIKWLHEKDPKHIISVCASGYSYIWDSRKLEVPLKKCELILPTELNCASNEFESFYSHSIQNKFSGSSLSLRDVSLSHSHDVPVNARDSEVLIGTHEGMIISLNLNEDFIATDTPGKMVKSIFGSDIYSKSIKSIEVNPGNHKYFSAVNDWGIEFWSTDFMRSPLKNLTYDTSQVLFGCWNPKRPSLFIVGREDGMVDFWDFFEDEANVSYRYQIKGSDATAYSISGDGDFIAAANSQGYIKVLKLSSLFTNERHNEKKSFNEFMKRSIKSVKQGSKDNEDLKRILLQSNEVLYYNSYSENKRFTYLKKATEAKTAERHRNSEEITQFCKESLFDDEGYLEIHKGEIGADNVFEFGVDSAEIERIETLPKNDDEVEPFLQMLRAENASGNAISSKEEHGLQDSDGDLSQSQYDEVQTIIQDGSGSQQDTSE